jgi:rSAM/selenodomain-associated transferase 1
VHHVRLVLFTRYPEPGKAKTRLIPALGADCAAALHRRLTERTLAAVRASGLRAEVRATGAELSALADWLGDDLPIMEQGDGDLGERLKRAAPPYPVLFIGADAPDLTPNHLRDAAKALETHPVVIGPAEDGGYWTIGLAAPCDLLFDAMPWGSEHVLRETLRRLRRVGIAPRLLSALADLDRPEDLARWPELNVGLPRD